MWDHRLIDHSERASECARHLAIALLLALVALGCATAADVTPRGATPDVAAPPGPNPLLWEARGPDGGTLYLLGSVHVGSEIHDFGPIVDGTYRHADELVVEIDLDPSRQEEMAALMLRYGLIAPPDTLQSHVSAETWALIEGFAAQRGMPLQGLAQFKPWVVATMLAVIAFQEAGFEGELGIDKAFMSRAAGASGKPIVALETAESQLAMMNSFPPEIQETMLVDTLTRMDDLKAEIASLVAAWKRGDEAELTSELFEPLEKMPELKDFYEAVFFSRNEKMSARLAELSRDGKRRFVVLGAGHMVGPRGIPSILADQGFTVEQISGSALPASGPSLPAAPAPN